MPCKRNSLQFYTDLYETLDSFSVQYEDVDLVLTLYSFEFDIFFLLGNFVIFTHPHFISIHRDAPRAVLYRSF